MARDLRRLAALLAAGAAIGVTTAASAQDVDITKSRDANIKIWGTIFGFRWGDPIFDADVPAGDRVRVAEPRWRTDTSTKQRLLASTVSADHSIAAVAGTPGSFTMEVMNDYLQAKHGLARVPVPDFWVESFFDVSFVVDLNEWSAPCAPIPPIGIQVVFNNGVNPALPGIHAGEGPFTFSSATGWFSPAPYSGPAEVIGQIGVGALAQDRFDFELPEYLAAPGGVPLGGQDGWYTPVTTPPSTDFQVYPHEFNMPGLFPDPYGVFQFTSGVSGPNNAFGRAQHDVNMASGDLWEFTYEMSARYEGVLPATQNLGSFSLQPSGSSQIFIALNTWSNLAAADRWNAGYVVWDETGLTNFEPTSPGPEWENLLPDHWYRQTTVVDFATNRIVEVSITDLETCQQAVVAPPDWYMNGGSVPALPRPTAIRLFTGGSVPGNRMSWDNLAIGQPLPARCYADCNEDGLLNLADFGCFQTRFALQSPYADCNGDGALNLADFGCFQTKFALGCP